MNEIPVTDDHVYWFFDDLKQRRIVKDRGHLYRLQKNQGFPRPYRLTKTGHKAAALFSRKQVEAWLLANLHIRNDTETE